MKKGLSILLVAAAIFGFYGSAVNVNDILACKDYWEEAGEKSTADMNKLEDGLNQLKDNEQAYLDGLDQIAEGEKTLAQGEADYAAAPGKLAAGRAALASGEKDYAAGKKTLAAAKSMLKQLKAGAKELQNEEEGYPAWRAGIELVYGKNYESAKAFLTSDDPSKSSIDADKVQAQLDALNTTKPSIDSAVAAYDGLAQVSSTVGNAQGSGDDDADTASAKVKSFKTAVGTVQAIAKKLEQGDAVAGLSSLSNNAEGIAQVKGACALLQNGILENVRASAAPTVPAGYFTYEMLKGVQKQIDDGIESCNNLLKLVAGKKTIQDKLLPLLEKVKDNDAVKQQLGDVNKIIAGLKGSDKVFEATMDQIMKKIPDLVATVSKAVKKGEKDLAAGAKKLAAGRQQLAQGLADYEAAPAKLADGRAQLAAGKDQLDQYEDGELQVRDGLATLVGTEADLDLESILDRLNGDSDFDNGDDHLDLDEGLNAVEVGRGYQAEDGELITKEIMTRAIGTGGLLAAGVLAVLAAILSFTKKNKGAGVCAILAAAAGAFGAYEATQAGSYFSSIAGSTVGQTGLYAAAVLGCVALVHAIVHFTAKKEA